MSLVNGAIHYSSQQHGVIDSHYLLPKEERDKHSGWESPTMSVVAAQDVQWQAPQALLPEVAWPLL